MSADPDHRSFATNVPYRLTSSVSLALFALYAAASSIPPPPRPAAGPLPEGVVSFDLCSMWVQTGPGTSLAAFVAVAAMAMVTIQGLRNRPGPRWLAVAGVPSLLLLLLEDWWRIRAGCYSVPSVAVLMAWLLSSELMLLHHAVQPRPNPLRSSRK